jgi:hypothetical protein
MVLLQRVAAACLPGPALAAQMREKVGRFSGERSFVGDNANALLRRLGEIQ